MKGGFSFCGVDIADIGLEYAPENKDTYIYAPAESNIHEETFEGHDGGYSYGASKRSKVFTLRCYYENKHIAQGVMAKALNLFKVGKKGMLVFKRRPWCYYYATVTSNPDISEMYSYLNGLITITMKAYYPFARGLAINDHLFYNLKTDKYHTEIMHNTAILDKDYMIPVMTFASVPQHNPILLYNPGTERAKVDIVISGNTSGVTITNQTTDQSCRYVALTTESTQCIYTDGINGKTVLSTLSAGGVAMPTYTDPLAFLYHDHGFIELEPAYPIVRDLYVQAINNYEGVSAVTILNTLYQDEEETDWYSGKYIYLGSNSNGKWYKINKCIDKHTLILTSRSEISEVNYKTNVVLMNEIYIQPDAGTSLNRLSFIYKPTYS